MLVQRRRRWANLKTTLGQRLLLAGLARSRADQIRPVKFSHSPDGAHVPAVAVMFRFIRVIDVLVLQYPSQ